MVVECQKRNILHSRSFSIVVDKAPAHTEHLSLEAGGLQLQNRTTDAEIPFFLAHSPNNLLFYAIHEPGELGSGDNGQVAAYHVEDELGGTDVYERISNIAKDCYFKTSNVPLIQTTEIRESVASVSYFVNTTTVAIGSGADSGPSINVFPP